MKLGILNIMIISGCMLLALKSMSMFVNGFYVIEVMPVFAAEEMDGASSSGKASEPKADKVDSEQQNNKNSDKNEAMPPALKSPSGTDKEKAIISTSEKALLARLRERRLELQALEQKLELRQSTLNAMARKIALQVKEMVSLRDQIIKARKQAESEANQEIMATIAVYETMNPKKAARIFDLLTPAIRTGIANKMKPDLLSAIMAKMQPDQSAALTRALALKRSLVTAEINNQKQVPKLPRIIGK